MNEATRKLMTTLLFIVPSTVLIIWLIKLFKLYPMGCLQPVFRMRMSYPSQPGAMIHETSIFYLIHLISLNSTLCMLTEPFHNSLLEPSISPFIPSQSHSWLTPPPSPFSSFTDGLLSKRWVRLPVSWRAHSISFPSLFFPSSIHPAPQWRGGMQGCIPGLMKLILQESRPKWSLNQHHKNKRLLV